MLGLGNRLAGVSYGPLSSAVAPLVKTFVFADVADVRCSGQVHRQSSHRQEDGSRYRRWCVSQHLWLTRWHWWTISDAFLHQQEQVRERKRTLCLLIFRSLLNPGFHSNALKAFIIIIHLLIKHRHIKYNQYKNRLSRTERLKLSAHNCPYKKTRLTLAMTRNLYNTNYM